MQSIKEEPNEETSEWTKECHGDCAHNMASGICGPIIKRKDGSIPSLCMLDGIHLDKERNCLSYQTELDYVLERACDGLLKALRNRGAIDYAKLLLDIDTGKGELHWRKEGDKLDVKDK